MSFNDLFDWLAERGIGNSAEALVGLALLGSLSLLVGSLAALEVSKHLHTLWQRATTFLVAFGLASAFQLAALDRFMTARTNGGVDESMRVTELESQLADLAEFSLVRPQHRSAPPPSAEGDFWFYSYVQRTNNQPGLTLCKERVRIRPSSGGVYDYEYVTIPAESSCDNPYSIWRGALIWNESLNGFIDLAEDPASNDFLISILRVPYRGDLRSQDSFGFQIGPGDFGTNPIANTYVLTRNEYADDQILALILSRSETHQGIVGRPQGQRPTVNCSATRALFGTAEVTEIDRCDGLEVIVPYSVALSQ